MKLRNDGWYRADEGKHFVLTEKGKAECASYSYKIVGEPVDEYDYEAVGWAVESGYVIEVDIPNWCTMIGYQVMYEHKGYELSAGNPQIFPTREIAEAYKKHYESHPWNDHELYIKEVEYQGRALTPCREYEGKTVFNKDYYSGCDALNVGDLVEEEIVDDLINCLPPACMRSDCSQLGEPHNHKIDDDGKTRATYVTFKRIAEGIWEYCGDCFRGENVQRGTELQYV